MNFSRHSGVGRVYKVRSSGGLYVAFCVFLFLFDGDEMEFGSLGCGIEMDCSKCLLVTVNILFYFK